MSVANRKDVRDAVQAALAVTITAAEGIEDGQPLSFDGRSPLVVVASNGSERGPGRTFAGVMSMVYLDVWVFVLASADADDTLDTIEQQIAAWMVANPKGSIWQSVSYAGRTKTQFIELSDGAKYKSEIIPLQLLTTS